MKKVLQVLWCYLRNHYGLNGREFCIQAGVYPPCKWCGK